MSDLVNFACSEIMLSGQTDVKKALIVAQIQVHLQLRGVVVYVKDCKTYCVLCKQTWQRILLHHHHPGQILLHAQMVTWSQHLCSSKGLQ